MNENNYIKVSDEVLNLINYENAYEILLVLNILKLAKPHKMIWGETSFLTTPSIIVNGIAKQEEPSRKMQTSILNSLFSLKDKGLINFETEKLNWTARLNIDCSHLLELTDNAPIGTWVTISLDELKVLCNQPMKGQATLIKSYLYVLSRLNTLLVQELIEHEGEFTLYDFEQNDNFNFTYMCDTLEFMRVRKNYRIECDAWISKNHLSDTLGALCDIGLLKREQRTMPNGSNKALLTKRIFYYLPIIEEWKMKQVIDRYITRRNWTQVNDNASESDSFDF